jgi:hypothetical protein
MRPVRSPGARRCGAQWQEHVPLVEPLPHLARVGLKACRQLVHIPVACGRQCCRAAMLLDCRRLRTPGGFARTVGSGDAHLYGAADVLADEAGGRQRRFGFNVLTDARAVGVYC